MVIYEFKCPECEEVITSEDKDLEIACAVCHDPVMMKRVYSLGGIAFKGSGFYKNDK